MHPDWQVILYREPFWERAHRLGYAHIPPRTPRLTCPEGWPTAHGARFRNTCRRTAHHRHPDRCESRMVGRCETTCP